MKKVCLTLVVTLMLIFQLSSCCAEVLMGGAKGFGGDILCSVTIDDGGKIIQIEIDADDEMLGKNAIEPMKERLMAAGNADVDTFAGSTITSNAIIEAFEIAMKSYIPGSADTENNIDATEGFSLRNGIMFGDSMDEVRSKEKLPIDEVDATAEKDEDYPYSLTTFRGTVAGVDGSYIVYNFDDNKQLREVIYWLKESSSSANVDAEYSSVNAGLVRKYGEPLANKDGKTHAVVGSAIDLTNYTVGLMNAFGGYAGICDYDEWVVFENGYNVKIEQVEYYAGQSRSKANYQQVLSYTYFTEADVESNIAEYAEKQSQIDADL